MRSNLQSALLAVVCICAPVRAREPNPNTDWFSKAGYATECEISVSSDQKRWRSVGHLNGGVGKPFEARFEKVAARYVRVRALKPDGAGQAGYQMSVAELEVYE